MRCPRCGDDYRDPVEVCAECRIPLVDPAAGPRPAALLGTFDPAVADPVTALLDDQQIVHELEPTDGAVRIHVDPARREAARAELTVRWPELLAQLPREQLLAVRSAAADGQLAGWHDAPRGAWVDRAGRLRVAAEPEEERAADARRVLGPSMVALGAVLVLFGWYAGSGDLPVVAGVVLVIGGLLAPR